MIYVDLNILKKGTPFGLSTNYSTDGDMPLFVVLVDFNNDTNLDAQWLMLWTSLLFRFSYGFNNRFFHK